MAASYLLWGVLPNLGLTPAASPMSDPSSSDHHPSRLAIGGAEEIMVVSGEDALLHIPSSLTEPARRILNSFRAIDGRPYLPAALLVAGNSNHQSVLPHELIIAFRNTVSLSITLRARAERTTSLNTPEGYWSNTFEIHPISITANGSVVNYGEGTIAAFAADSTINLTHSPEIGVAGSRLHSDAYLRRALSGVWKEVLAGNGEDPLHRGIFRSMRMAYHASSIHTHNVRSLEDYGVSVAHWVSALETLIWHCNSNSSHRDVHDVLGGYRWASAQLCSPQYKCRMNRTEVEGNAVQYLASFLYQTRNAFLHGNPVGHDLLKPPELGESAWLPQIAAVVYRTALCAILERHWPQAQLKDWESLSEPNADEYFAEYPYSQALKACVGIADPSPEDDCG